MLKKVRAPLLSEAKMSPSLLSDLAGLEEYIAESYDSRSFIELLQNADDAGASRFLIEKCGTHLALAFAEKDGAVEKLDDRSAVVHAFLPTNEITGLSVKLHGDISTDPSRTRVVFDDRTEQGIFHMAELVLSLIEEAVSGGSLKQFPGMLSALLPSSDPRICKLQKRSFKSELFAALEVGGSRKYSGMKCRPAWINPVDFEMLTGRYR